MKFLQQIACFIFVSVFILQTFNKTIIYFNFELNKDYITKNLCVNRNKPQMHCNGKCHLKKQLAKEEKKEQSPANSTKEKNEIQFFSEINSNINLLNPSVTTILRPSYSLSLSEKHLHAVFLPPKV